MGLSMNFFQFFDAVVGIHLRGCQAAVPQQFLDGIQVGAVVGQVGGKGVAEYVRTALFQSSNGGQVFFNNVVDAFG